MKKHKLRRAFSFDAHFATAGFRLLARLIVVGPPEALVGGGAG
jgi:hypothetical protein